MPKKVEERLKRQAQKKGLTGERADAYVYGTMQERGLMPKKKGGSKRRKKRKKSDFKLE